MYRITKIFNHPDNPVNLNKIVVQDKRSFTYWFTRFNINICFIGKEDVEIIIITKPKDDSVPEGYMTLEEFRTESKASLMQILNEHGTLFTI